MTVPPISYELLENPRNKNEPPETPNYSSKPRVGAPPCHGGPSAESLLPVKENSTSTECCSGSSDYPLRNGTSDSRPMGERWGVSLRDWAWEFAAIIFSVGCATTMAAILIKIQNKSLSEWHLPFSPNTFVSTLSTASKASLMVPLASCISQLKWIYFSNSARSLQDFELFDRASRGPMGALDLLWGCRLRTGLAMLGSIVTILALAMDPSTQAILVYPSRNITTGDTALVGASQIYDNGGFARVNGAITSRLDPKIQAAIVNGLFNTGTSMPYNCPTANCTWDSFYTLSVCSSCTDVTDQTMAHCENKGHCGADASICVTSSADLDCNYTTPSGFTLNGYFFTGGSGGGSWTLLAANATAEYSHKDPNKTTIAKFAAASLLPATDFSSKNVSSYLSHPPVTECELKWCVRKYSGVAVVNGVLDAGTSESFDLATNRTRAWPCEAGFTNCPYNASSTAADSGRPFDGNASFSFNAADAVYMSEYLASVLTTTEEATSNTDAVTQSANFGNALLAAPDMAATVRNVADSITYAIAAHRNATPAVGTAARAETFVRVRWEWFALPLAVVALGAAFLAATVVHARRSAAAAWKTASTLAFFVRLDGWGEEDVRVASSSAGELERRARRMRAVLVEDAKGGILLQKA